MGNFNFLFDMEFWFGIIAIIGFVWIITSTGKLIGKFIEKIKN
jgi:hypothetical protein